MAFDEIIRFLIQHGYEVLFLWVLLEQLGLPIPAAPLLMAAGALAGLSKLNVISALLTAFTAALISDISWYQIGLHRGRKVLPFLCRLSLNPESCVRQTKDLFRRYGPRSLLAAKFFPGFNAIAAPLSGIIKMPFKRFVLFDGLGVLLWAGCFIGLGYLFHQQIESLASFMARLGNGVGLVVLGSLFLYVGLKAIQRRRFLKDIKRHRISPEEVLKKINAGEEPLILDLRSADDFETEPQVITGAVRLPLEKLDENHHKIPRDRDIILYCT
jgi:membrane protein DedA with SNARE-associated domain